MQVQNQINVICATNDSYTQHCGVMLCSLFENSSKSDFSIYILTSGLTKSNALKLNKLVDHYGHSLQELIISKNDLPTSIPLHGHISIETYFRILIPQILPADIDKVLYLDVDLIVLKDIAQLWNINISGHSLGACATAGNIERKTELAIPDRYSYIGAGVLLINLKYWRDNGVSSLILDYIMKNHRVLELHDQDAINACMYDQIKLIDQKYNVYSPYFSKDAVVILNSSKEDINRTIRDAVIIHFTGDTKPWHLENKHPMKLEYYKYLKMTPWKGYSPILNKVRRYFGKFLTKSSL